MLRQFIDPLLEETFINIYHETFTLVLDSEYQCWLYHSDINEDFEKIEDINDIVLNDEELAFLKQFSDKCSIE